MDFYFTKPGVVELNNGQNTPIQMTDPIGKPLEIIINMPDNKLDLSIRAYDSLNRRTWAYPIQLDQAAQMAVAQFFQEHIIRLAEQSYPEFVDLTPIAPPSEG